MNTRRCNQESRKGIVVRKRITVRREYQEDEEKKSIDARRALRHFWGTHLVRASRGTETASVDIN
jgi:hypothetical protein